MPALVELFEFVDEPLPVSAASGVLEGLELLFFEHAVSNPTAANKAKSLIFMNLICGFSRLRAMSPNPFSQYSFPLSLKSLTQVCCARHFRFVQVIVNRAI
jgi:hypothetical protein